MISRRRAIYLALTALPSAWLQAPPRARADQSFERFLPLFVDLDGWQGAKPTGMSMQMAGASITTATRDYRRDTAQLHASVMLGAAAAVALAPTLGAMNIETSEGHMITSTIGGLKVVRTFTIAQRSGAIIVALGPSAVFSVAYNGITEDEAMPLAEKFDWKAIQATAQLK